MSKVNELIDLVLARVEKAEADGSFALRVNTWLTAGDGRDFCAQAPGDMRRLARMLKTTILALQTIEDLAPIQERERRELSRTALAEIERIAGGK